MAKPLQKVKLLLLYEYLKLNSDEGHPVTTANLVEALESLGVECDRRTIARDIEILNQSEHEIMKIRIGHSDAYYISDTLFNISELKILIDAMHAASFVTNKKTEQMIDKLLHLCSKYDAKILANNRVIFNQKKHNNEQILYVIEAIEKALEDQKKIQFLYFYLDENKEKQYRHQGDYYQENPISLIYVEDFNYLVTYNEKHDHITHYRIDRMEKCETIDESIHPYALTFRDHISEYTEQMFKMYSGEVVETTFQFHQSMINPLYDRFGEEINIIKLEDDLFEATMKVQLSPTFFGWLHTFTNQIRIISPQSVIDEHVRRLQENLQQYK